MATRLRFFPIYYAKGDIYIKSYCFITRRFIEITLYKCLKDILSFVFGIFFICSCFYVVRQLTPKMWPSNMKLYPLMWPSKYEAGPFGFLHRFYEYCQLAVCYMYVFACLRLVELYSIYTWSMNLLEHVITQYSFMCCYNLI